MLHIDLCAGRIADVLQSWVYQRADADVWLHIGHIVNQIEPKIFHPLTLFQLKDASIGLIVLYLKVSLYSLFVIV